MPGGQAAAVPDPGLGWEEEKLVTQGSSLGESRVAGDARGSVPVPAAWREGTAAGHLRELSAWNVKAERKKTREREARRVELLNLELSKS